MTDIKAIALKSEGDEKVREGDYHAAIRFYLKAVQLDPRFLQAWNNLGYCFTKLGKTEEAKQVQRSILEINRNIESGEVTTQDIVEKPVKDIIDLQQPKQKSKSLLYFAGAWNRWFAYILDSLLVFGIILIPAVLLSVWFPDNPAIFWIFIPVFLVAYWLYFAVLEAGVHQATVGKRLLRIYVTDDEGDRLPMVRSLGRSFFKIILTFTPFSLLTLLSGIVISTTTHSKGLHDYLAKTLVLTRKANDKPFSPGTHQKSSNIIYIVIIAILLLIAFIVVAALMAVFVLGWQVQVP
ncbi:MAG: RDD family protein [Methanoregulaceae archaeon]|nr:RDD family protein [Methanoregulaceae archaeon]